MRTVILVINQRTDTSSNVFLGNRLGTMCRAFLGGEGGKPKFEGKREKFFKKLREKDKTLIPRKNHLQTAWFGVTYSICLKQCFFLSFLLFLCSIVSVYK